MGMRKFGSAAPPSSKVIYTVKGEIEVEVVYIRRHNYILNYNVAVLIKLRLNILWLVYHYTLKLYYLLPIFIVL